MIIWMDVSVCWGSKIPRERTWDNQEIIKWMENLNLLYVENVVIKTVKCFCSEQVSGNSLAQFSN